MSSWDWDTLQRKYSGNKRWNNSITRRASQFIWHPLTHSLTHTPSIPKKGTTKFNSVPVMRKNWIMIIGCICHGENYRKTVPLATHPIASIIDTSCEAIPPSSRHLVKLRPLFSSVWGQKEENTSRNTFIQVTQVRAVYIYRKRRSIRMI